MRQFAILLLSILVFSCSEKKQQQADTEIADTTKKETYIEKYVREKFVEPWEKRNPDMPKETYEVTDSTKLDNLNCTIYIITHLVTDGESYCVIQDENRNFYPFNSNNYYSQSNLSIDDAYKILNYKNHANQYVFIEPFPFELKGLEVFLNQYVNQKNDLKMHDINMIFENVLKLKKIQSPVEIDSLLTQVESLYKVLGYKSNHKKELIKSLSDGLKYPDKFSMFALNRGILCVYIYPMAHYYSIRIFRIQ